MFLTPLYLWALSLIAIPVLIHLIRRRKLKVIHWAAMDFLMQSQRKQRRRLRIEELILLALRMLIVALVALALSRPILRSLGVSLLAQNAPVYAVLVLDNSYSMGYKGADGKRSFERAKALANDILDKALKSGDSVSVVSLSNKADPLIASPSFDLKAVRQRLNRIEISDRPTDYLDAARSVNRLLRASKASVKEVYWITDDQSRAWETSQSEAAKGVWNELGKQARLLWASVGAAKDRRDNIVVTTPLISRELVTPQLPARIETLVVNHSLQPRNNVLVKLLLDGKENGTRQVNLPANGSAQVEFTPRFVTPGSHTGRIELDSPELADGLAKDNGTSFAVRVRERIRVLLLDPRPTRDPAKSEAFYLLTALSLTGDNQTFSVRLQEGAGLGSANLRDYDAVILAGMTSLSASDRKALAEYALGGGGVLLYPGPNTDANRLNSDPELAALLPARLGARRTLSEEEAISLNPASVAHPALSLFKDTSVLNIGMAQFTTYYPLEPIPTTDPNAIQVMLRFSNGDPALMERKFGLGKVVLAASSAGSAWNQLPLRAAYVPMAYQLLIHLGQGASSRCNLRLEEPFFRTLPLPDANKPVRVTTPSNQTVSVSSALDSRGLTFSFTGTRQAGLYQAEVQGGKTRDAFAVGLPTEEGDLKYADPREETRKAGVPDKNLAFVENAAQLLNSIQQARYGAEFWRPLIWAVIVLLFVESLLACAFGRRG